MNETLHFDFSDKSDTLSTEVMNIFVYLFGPQILLHVENMWIEDDEPKSITVSFKDGDGAPDLNQMVAKIEAQKDDFPHLNSVKLSTR